jgi:hypothetical protein
MSNLIQVAQNLYAHRAEIAAAVTEIAGGVGIICTGLAHFPKMPAKWAERFARCAVWTSQKFSVNKRPVLSGPVAPEAEK